MRQRDGPVLATYVKDGYIHLSLSLDCGAMFNRTEKILKVNGEIKDIQVITKDNQFVVGIKETVSGKDHREQSLDGYFPTKAHSDLRNVPEFEVQGKIVNISLGFRENESGKHESVDYVFYLSEDGKVSMQSKGNPCLIK